MALGDTAKLTLGPVLMNWPAEHWRDFYFRIADEAPVDTVYLGEVVCSKRAPFFAPHIAEISERLAAAGKSVVYSTFALVMNAREQQATRALCGDPSMMVEINDISALSSIGNRPHVIGPYVNVYNEATLQYLAGNGAVRVCLPFELPEAALASLGAAAAGLTELEFQVFGRVPLALSARCYHARAHNLHKDNCRFVCGEDPDGMDLETLDGQAFLAINGIQTMSHACLNLADRIEVLAAAGIGCFRLSPQDCDMIKVAASYRAMLDGMADPGDVDTALNGSGLKMPTAVRYHTPRREQP